MIYDELHPITLGLTLIGLVLIGMTIYPIIRKTQSATTLRNRLGLTQYGDHKNNVSGRGQAGNLLRHLPHRNHILPLLFMAACGLLLIYLEPIKHWHPAVRIMIVGMTVYIGYRIPQMRYEQKIKIYREEIERDLPAMIDLLVIMLDSGSTFDHAISRIVDDKRIPDSAIKKEFSKLHAELAVTPERQLAFHKFASAVALNDLRLLASVLIQSENFGTPISKGLRSLSYEIRERQFHIFEAHGSALGPKLAIPMALFFLPLIFIVVLAPTIIRTLNLS